MGKAPKKVTAKAARAELWRRGVLSWKLHGYQLPIYSLVWDYIQNRRHIKHVLNISRRWGKSYTLVLAAIEYAIRNPGSQVRFAAPTGKALRKIIHPAFKTICKDAPDDVKPVWKSQDGFYALPNGSEIHASGCDNQNYENLRGQAAHLAIVDEAGFVDELDYVVNDVLVPQTLTTKGVVIMSSTPPRTPAHDFYSMAQEAEQAGAYAKRTIFDNTTIDRATLDLYAKEAGGYESSTFKREYLCEFVVDSDSQLIPEWNEGYVADSVPTEYSGYWHKYAAMDIGVRDGTALVFGHYNFAEARLYIEDEFVLRGQEVRTDNIAKGTAETERRLWNTQKPYRRISDNNNLILLADLGLQHGLHFAPTSKDELHAMVNELRLWVRAGRIRISPKCDHLLGCLRYGVWDDQRKAFARSSVYGHFDGLAALIYLVRNIDQHTNPVPIDHSVSHFTHYIPQDERQSKAQEAFKKVFKVNR
ncbi:Terminase-like family [uncultured Caudovirales phage]|uniref:Terminase-like family n=1 Tax=uncultured Caudovirales phage TaxID=2100421 RepID=A0A6J5S2X1_9CAUD|nr:Terminase-like family [uncultured Caudovirales phage]